MIKLVHSVGLSHHIQPITHINLSYTKGMNIVTLHHAVRNNISHFILGTALGKLSNRKSSQTWKLVQIGGWLSKNQKSPKFQLGIVQN